MYAHTYMHIHIYAHSYKKIILSRKIDYKNTCVSIW